MDGPRLMSGSDIVAKGATKKVDGQLPQIGLKEVFANGSWLEQKQIQSALEARKHLIAVERIEKSGSISHAEWKDDLKLAEVTKQTGGYWQYMGHKKGKHLYLLPEETLFLMEVNSLLLKHNDVTVSLQKAYALCLTEMPLMQYKVYASLSRLGYRVSRHKEPILILTGDTHTHVLNDNDMETDENVTEKVEEKCMEKTNDNVTIESVQEISVKKNEEMKIDDTVVPNTEHEDSSDVKDHNTESCDITVVQIDNNSNAEINISKDGGASASNIHNETENMKMEVVNNNITSNGGENCTNDAEKEVLKNGVIPTNEKTDDTDANITVDTTNNTENLNEDTTISFSCSDKEKSSNSDNSVNNQEIVDITAKTVDIVKDDTVVALDFNRKIAVVKHECTDNNLPHAINSGIVYSIDETGVVRPGDTIITMDTTPDSSSEINVQVNPNDSVYKTKDSGWNDSSNHYQVEIKYFDQKIHKISERKTADQTNNKGLDTLQDLYKERIVDVNVPEETYLPRNIFLHKTAYRLNIDVIQNQNASNVSSDEMDSVESPSRTPSVPIIQNHIYPNYGNNNTNNIPRYPTYRFERPQYYRQNFQMSRPPMQGVGYYTPRWRVDFMRHQYMAYQANRRDNMKTYHYNTIVNIATRFKNGFIANPSQIRALHSLLNTYNLRYNATIGITPDFNIIDTKLQSQPESIVENVIVLDDEPKHKKQRLDDESDKTKTNLEKLKELAAKLKDLHTRHLDTSRHRRVFSNAIKSYNKSFKADIYLNDSFEIVDRKLVVLDSSSDSEPVVVKEKERPRKRKKLRNPYSILRQTPEAQNDHASTSTQLPESQRLPQEEDFRLIIEENHANTDPIAVDNKDEGLLKYFNKAWLPNNDDFGRAEPCTKQKAQLDALLYQAEYLQDILKESTDFESWKDIKIAVLKEIRGSLDVQKQQAEALSNDFYMETESQIRPILEKGCADLKTALKKLSVIPNNKEIAKETSLKMHFDVCNRDVPFKKSSPPKPNFRVVCYEETSSFPPSGEVAALQAKYQDGIPTVFAFVGTSASIIYLQINPTDLPMFIPDLQ